MVQLGADGTWQPWIERSEIDRTGLETLTIPSLGYETCLAGDRQGRLLMARRWQQYDVREYKKSGRLGGRLLHGDVPEVESPEGVTRKLKELMKDGRVRITRDMESLVPVIEGVAWSPEAEILILAKVDGGYALDRWVPALGEHVRLPVEELTGERRIHMASTRAGLLFVPANSSKLVFLPWEYLRNARWQSLEEDSPPEGG